jgi:hypothetical protein
MNDENQSSAGQAAAFQKIWAESLSTIAQSAMAFAPASAPEETIRQIRSGILKALAHSWEEFLRSPEFLQGMKQWMDQSIAFRQMSHDFMAKARQEFQEPSRSDLDGLLVAVRSLEHRILARVEELSTQVEELRQRFGPDAHQARSSKASSEQASRPSKRPTHKPKRRRP